MFARPLWGLLALLSPVALSAPRQSVPPDSLPLRDLRSVLDTGVVLQDRNGDRVVDDLAVRILLPVSPSAAEAAVAGNVAARLAFETSATDLGLVERVGGGGAGGGREGRRTEPPRAPVIVVGEDALATLLSADLEEPGADLRLGLAPGQGVAALLPSTGATPAGGVALQGADASGLLAVAEYFSGRYPAVWEPEGTTWREFAERVEGFAKDHGAPEARITLDRIVVERERPGVARARVTVEVSDSVAFGRMVAGFTGADTVPGFTGADTTAGAPGGAEEEGSAEVMHLERLEVQGLHRVDVRILGPSRERTVTLRPKKPWALRADSEERVPSGATFSLDGLYEVGGLFRDTDRDLVPDESTAFLSISGGEGAEAIADLATRIGLETAGLRLPLVRVDRQEDDPTWAGLPVLVGTDHYQVGRLREEGKLRTPRPGPGEGRVQFVEHAFGDGNALVVEGGDTEGLAAALRWLAGRAPYLWRYGKGEFRLGRVEEEVRRFVQACGGAGQLALATAKLGTWMDRFPEEEPPPGRLEVELAAEEVPEGAQELLEQIVRERFPSAELSVKTASTGFGVGDTIFVEEWDVPWEVEEVRRVLAEEVYPAVEPGAPAVVEVRVSEPPEIRAALEEEIRRNLREAEAGEATVRVLSAYKQGFSWIHDELLPRLRNLPVASVELTYHTLEESEEVRWQTVAAETRWLQEVYPFDAVLARELGIPDSSITFHPTRRPRPIYTFVARDSAGAVLLEETFNPRYVVRHFFDLFPEYEQVRVTTGWITASSGQDTLVDRRVATDPERFWDRLQSDIYRRLIDYIMDSQEGEPSADNAPFFDEFRVDLRLSEPDYRIGIDEETISSLEALHEDIFFETHTLLTLLGNRYQTSLSYPGRVLPFVDPGGAGRPGRARVSLTGKERGNPKLLLRAWPAGASDPVLHEYELAPLPIDPPRLSGATVRAGEEGLRGLSVDVVVTDSVDRYEEFKRRSSEEAIDRQFPSVELVESMVSALGRLEERGLLEETLSWDRVGELALELRVKEDTLYHRTVTVPRNAHPASTDLPRLSAAGWRYQGEPLVQWETPIPPAENDSILARLGTFPGVTVYYLTDSYLGHHVWAADFLPPQDAAYLSQAKLNALKPTLFVSGREHANEVSSTSHILRLGELLATDSTYREMLKKVNVVLHPMTNPDGAQLAYERQRVNPDHMLHAGRPGALGVDATSGGSSPDPIYPESRARTMIRQAWLPDIYLNPHGYPSHEWVQYFAGYSAWVRGRRVGPRDWWVPRGWFIPGFSWVEDKENPDYKRAQFAILDSLAAAMTSARAVDEVNRRLYARYRKYGEQDRDGFTEYLYKGIVVNMRLRGAESIGTGLNSPRITYFGITTEAPDETARGDWLKLMCEAGLAHTSAALRYLATGTFEVKREAKASRQGVTRKVYRVKPVLPPEPPSSPDSVLPPG